MKTDAELIERAERAGWKWLVNFQQPPWGTVQYPATGWQHENSFRSCSEVQKADALRGKINTFLQSPGFDHDYDCTECCEPIWLAWDKRAEERLIYYRECFTCNHWMDLVRSNDGIRVERSDGRRTHYQPGPQKEPGNYNGFGGQWFFILFTDGTYQKSCDLWCQGDIPERFWDRLPINATFLDELAGKFLDCLPNAC